MSEKLGNVKGSQLEEDFIELEKVRYCCFCVILGFMLLKKVIVCHFSVRLI